MVIFLSHLELKIILVHFTLSSRQHVEKNTFGGLHINFIVLEINKKKT